MDKETAKAINNLSNKINSVERKLDRFFSALHLANEANIDYIAMMSDIDIPDKTEEGALNE